MGEVNLEKLLNLLEKLGIKGYEASAYLAILKLKEATASEIAIEANIPQPRIYDVLKSLAKRGLIEYSMDRPRRYRALPPSRVIPIIVNELMNELESVGRALVDELNKLYSAKRSDQGPNLWISHSIESGIEKMKELIRSSSMDVIIAVDGEIFKKISLPLIKQAQSMKSSIYPIVLYSVSEDRVPKKVFQLENVIVKKLRTGYINIVSGAPSRFVIVMKNYVIDVDEYSLYRITEDFFYHSLWRAGELIKDLSISHGNVYIIQRHWLALEVIKRALDKGFRIKAFVKGLDTKRGTAVEVLGSVVDIVYDEYGLIRAFTIETDGGVNLTIGGYGATIEDVEASLIRLEIL